MGHRVPSHKGKCRNLHGHRYKIEAGVDDRLVTKRGASDEGMVIDFGELKKIMMKYVDEYLDHGFMMYNREEFFPVFSNFKVKGQKIIFVDFVPTVENITKHLFFILQKQLRKKNISLRYVKMWETPTSTSIYTFDNSFEDDDQTK